MQKLTGMFVIVLLGEMRPDLPHVTNYCIWDYGSKERVQLCQKSYYVADGESVG